ncbi:hypothetical protein NL580_001880 [Salmonella enterica]|nr:hypothetical protein [Salmonella enterica]EEO4912400.1 hypothetical protein [Salmonella enterica]EFQ7406450.1 hypothetical protein [Salmonella enterica]EGL3643883.1 hypothetical protein [Salmonella enterica]EIM1654645.1 hypothetical protein [Salmonella enterica]
MKIGAKGNSMVMRTNINIINLMTGTDAGVVGRQLFLHGSEMLQTHRQVNNDAAYGRFGDFALR